MSGGVCLHQNHIFALKTNDDLSAEYVSFLSASLVGRDYFDVTANQSVHLASTNSTTIMNFTIPIPSIEDEYQIMSQLAAAPIINVDIINGFAKNVGNRLNNLYPNEWRIRKL